MIAACPRAGATTIRTLRALDVERADGVVTVDAGADAFCHHQVRSMVGALLGVTTVGMNHIFVAWLKQRAIWFRKFADGTPIPVIEQGNWNEERMKKMRLQEQDVMSAARNKGIGSLDDIDMAVVERNGEISIFKKAA